MTTRVQAHDFMQLSARHMTDEGYLVAPMSTLARTGVQTYRAYELGLDATGMDPMRPIRLHRPAEEVFNPESMKSFESKPVTIEHPPVAVTASNWEELAKGEARDIVRHGELMAGTVIIKSQEAIDAVQGGKVELSNGYSFELDMTPGTTADGHAYDGVQRNIRGNHIAIVDAARCGSACRIADSKPNLKENNTMAERKVIVDGIPLEVSDTAAAAIEKLVKERDTAVKTAADAEAKLTVKVGDKIMSVDELVKLVGDQAAQMEALKKDVMTPEARDAMVADWVKLIGDAKRLHPELVTDGKTCLQIRKEVIQHLAAKDATAKAVSEAVLAGKTIEAADADVARAVFNAVAAAVKTEANDDGIKQVDDAVAKALVGDGDPKVKAEDGLTGRDKFLQRMQGNQ